MKQTEDKFQEICDSYLNGNISAVKESVKKLSKENRKSLYKYSKEYLNGYGHNTNFFFNLI